MILLVIKKNKKKNVKKNIQKVSRGSHYSEGFKQTEDRMQKLLTTLSFGVNGEHW